jgi:rhodanese-related sulfurtransferase
MPRTFLPRPAARTAVGLALVALLGWPTTGRTGPAASGEGRVLAASGQHLLVQTQRGTSLLRLQPGASLVGPADPVDLLPGDLVRYHVVGSAAGALQVDRLEAPPPVRVPADHTVSPAALLQQPGTPAAPRLLDVRSPERIRAGRLPGATPSAAVLARLSRDAPVVIYGDDDRSEEAPALLRRLLAEGLSGVQVLEGGLRRWSLEGHPLLVAPTEAARRLAAAPGLLAIDVRPPAQLADGTLPGAISITPEALRLADFDGGRPLLPLLLVGGGPDDPAVAAVAERIRLVRAAGEGALPLEILVLEGGLPAWRAAGLPLQRGAPPTAIPFRAQLEGEIDPAEFARLWRAEGAGEAVILDVRRASTTEQPWVLKIPLDELPARLGELPRDRKIVVFCTLGLRSRIAHELLVRSGLRASFLRARNPL